MNRKVILGEITVLVLGILACMLLLQKDVFRDVKQWGLERNVDGKNNYYSSQVGFYEYGYAALTEGTEIVQELKVTESMLKDEKLRVALLFGTFQRVNTGKLLVELIQGGNCQRQSFLMEEVEESCPFPITFLTEELTEGAVKLRISSPDAGNDNCIAAYIRMPRGDSLVALDMESEKREDTAAMFRYALVNGMEQSGPLAMELYSYTD